MAFWRELWREYRELAKFLVGIVLELTAVLILIKLGGFLIRYLEISPSCSRGQWIECTHTVVLISAWAGLLGSFIIVATIFAYRHTIRRIREMQLAEEVKEVKDYSSGIVVALTSMEPAARDSDRVRAIEILLDLRKKNALDRKVTMFLGRLHKLRREYERAAESSSFFLEEKARIGQTLDKDYADVLYNRACYRALHASRLTDAAAADKVKQAAYEDLARSIRISPENAIDARDDPDFNLLRGEPRFQELTEPKRAS